MSNRVDFPLKVRQAVALRAGYRCSFPGCGNATVGPSEESPTASANVGNAAHIAAAAPGGRRYDPSMTVEQRSSIANAIWMCVLHATLIDRDEATYSTDVIKGWKTTHEKLIAEEVARVGSNSTSTMGDLIGIGTNIVAVGDLQSVQTNRWQLTLSHFVAGDLTDLTAIAEKAAELPAADRYVLVNSLGDGRVFDSIARWQRMADGAVSVELVVQPRFDRIPVAKLGDDVELIEVDGRLDLSPAGSLISGLRRFPQHLVLVLADQKGAGFVEDAGSRISEFYALYGSTPWFQRLAKLELIRLAAIPYADSLLKKKYTPFQCVEKVVSVEVLASAPLETGRLPVRLALELAGHGRWQEDLNLYILDYPPKPIPLPSASGFGPSGLKP